MTSTFEPTAAAIVPARDDALFQLQLRVACRADEITRESGMGRRPAWLAWIQAEREILTTVGAGGRPETGSHDSRA